MSIPKTIHYCWFGNGLKGATIINCIKSWQTHLPEYEIIEWNELNCEFKNEFCIQALRQKKWAFLSDYIRLKVLYNYGGIYLDTDMLVIKPFGPLLQQPCFLGYQDNGQINGSIIGSVKGNDFIRACLDKYEHLKFNGLRLMSIAIPLIISEVYQGFAQKGELTVYPYTYFYPYKFNNSLKGINYLNSIQPETYAVHLWNASWFTGKELAGFAFEHGEYIKGIRLFIAYTIKNPKSLLNIPAMLTRKLFNTKK